MVHFNKDPIMEFGDNLYSKADTSLEDRAKLLNQFMAALVRDPAGPSSREDLTLMIQSEGTAVPYCHPYHHTDPQLNQRGYTPSGGDFSVSGDRAESALLEHEYQGYQINWNDPASGTDGLISVDADSRQIYDACPETLEVISGSGNRHLIYANPSGDIESSWLNNDSCINADPSTYTVVPGSIHRSNGGIYSLANWSDITRVSAEDLADLEGALGNK